jgi:hypothetical protein
MECGLWRTVAAGVEDARCGISCATFFIALPLFPTRRVLRSARPPTLILLTLASWGAQGAPQESRVSLDSSCPISCTRQRCSVPSSLSGGRMRAS